MAVSKGSTDDITVTLMVGLYNVLRIQSTLSSRKRLAFESAWSGFNP
jgi:hypothetical protein